MTSPTLSQKEIDLLNVMLETLIPASPERGLPSAAKVGFLQFATTKGILPKMELVLQSLQQQARERHAADFAALVPALRLQLLTDRTSPQAAAQSEMQTYLLQCYYQNPVVVVAIGMESRAPFPEGYHVEEGDLLLLEPVSLRGKLYRDV